MPLIYIGCIKIMTLEYKTLTILWTQKWYVGTSYNLHLGNSRDYQKVLAKDYNCKKGLHDAFGYGLPST